MSDIRADMRSYLKRALALYDPGLVALIQDRIVDSQTLAPDDLPLIWFTRTSVMRDDQCSDRPSSIVGANFAVEFCGDSAQIQIVQRMETAIMCMLANFRQAPENFGSRFVQLVEFEDVDDNYQPYVAGTIEGVYWTAVNLNVYF